MKYRSQVGDKAFQIEITNEGAILLDGEPIKADLLQVGPLGLYSLLIDNRSYELVVEETQQGYRVGFGSDSVEVDVADERQLRMAAGRAGPAAPAGELTIKAPIPGLVSRIFVQKGEMLKSNQPMAILEAMKMENELRSPRAGVVIEIKIKAGETVEQNAPLFVIGEPEHA